MHLSGIYPTPRVPVPGDAPIISVPLGLPFHLEPCCSKPKRVKVTMTVRGSYCVSRLIAGLLPSSSSILMPNLRLTNTRKLSLRQEARLCL